MKTVHVSLGQTLHVHTFSWLQLPLGTRNYVVHVMQHAGTVLHANIRSWARNRAPGKNAGRAGTWMPCSDVTAVYV